MPKFQPIFRFPVSGNPVDGYLESYLTDDLGQDISIDEAMRRWGNLRIRRAAMNSAIRDFSQRPRLRGYPPKVFISYRWEDESVKAWARQLAGYLRQRGFHPYLDQEHQQNIGAGGIGIGKYVARIVNSNIVLVVVTPAYLAGELREWLTEEGQYSRLMSHLGTEIVFLWKEGGELPDWGGAFTVVDMKGNIDDFSPLDKFFDYQGLRFSEAEEEELVQLLIDVQTLAEQGKASTAFSLLAKAEKFSDTEEYRQMLCHLLLHTERILESAQLAVDTLNLPHLKDETIIDLALLLEEVGLKQEALATICRFPSLSRKPFLRWRLSYMKGNLLDDVGNYMAALNHLHFALQKVLPYFPYSAKQEDRSVVLNTLGYIHLFRLGDVQSALPLFEEATALSPTGEDAWINLILSYAVFNDNQKANAAIDLVSDRFKDSPRFAAFVQAVKTGQINPSLLSASPISLDQYDHLCSSCGAKYKIGQENTLCARCGSVHSGFDCPYCGNSAFLLLGIEGIDVLCPICGEGKVFPVNV